MAVDRPHILVPAQGQRYDFESRQTGGNNSRPGPVQRRAANAVRIVKEFESVIRRAKLLKDSVIDEARIPISARAGSGWGVNASVPGRANEVLSVVGFGKNARANIAFDPETIDRIQTYADRYIQHTDGRRPNHYDFFEAQPSIAMTSIEDLWASKLDIPIGGKEAIWEIWLPPTAESRLREVLDVLGLRARRASNFDKIRVLALEATREDVTRLTRSAAISQLRPASSLISNLVEVPAGVQVAAVAAAARRVKPADADAPAVCVLDTGIQELHPLLKPSIDLRGTVVTSALGQDWNGHGTRMAGLALYDTSLAGLVGSRLNVTLSTRLESVQIDAAPGTTGVAPTPAERLRQGVAIAEETAPDRRRTYCLAMNAPEETDDGGISSLSCELDELAADSLQPRLFCVAAGNIDGTMSHTDYQNINEITGMLSPSQAWNALSVRPGTS